jgi:hypothetical protein
MFSVSIYTCSSQQHRVGRCRDARVCLCWQLNSQRYACKQTHAHTHARTGEYVCKLSALTYGNSLRCVLTLIISLLITTILLIIMIILLIIMIILLIMISLLTLYHVITLISLLNLKRRIITLRCWVIHAKPKSNLQGKEVASQHHIARFAASYSTAHSIT